MGITVVGRGDDFLVVRALFFSGFFSIKVVRNRGGVVLEVLVG